jgi:hypothetical protein
MTKIIIQNFGETQFGRLREKWEGCIKRDLKETDSEGVTGLNKTQNLVWCQLFVITYVKRVSLWVTHEPRAGLSLQK